MIFLYLNEKSQITTFDKYTKNKRVVVVVVQKSESESESVHSSLDIKSALMSSMFLTISTSLPSSSSLEGTRVANEAAIDVSDCSL